MFLYYIPGHNKTSKPDLAPLRYALGDGDVIERNIRGGIDGSDGLLLANSHSCDAAAVRFDANGQTWQKMPSPLAGQLQIWVGHWTDQRPTPGSLQRDQEAVTGRWITDETGARWLIPAARLYVEIEGDFGWITNLPTRRSLNDQGRWENGEVKARYSRLWDLACRFADSQIAAADEDEKAQAQPITFSFDDLDQLAVEALGTNYRIGPVELDMLGIYDDQFGARIAEQVIDVPGWRDLAKKKLAESGAISAGQPPSTPDDPPDTPQQSPTSEPTSSSESAKASAEAGDDQEAA